MRISNTNYDLGHDFKVREIRAGGKIVDTGIHAYPSNTKSLAGEREGFSLAMFQMELAIKDVEKAYPGSKGKLALMDGATVDNLNIAQVSQFGAADWWIVYNSVVAFSPLAVRLASYRGKVDFDGELNGLSGGVLAELK